MSSETAINTLRFLAVDAVQKANSGHPGMPMGAAPMAYVLWTKFLNFDPTRPDWADRDRFVLSAGHGSMLLYGLLHLSGYELGIEELKNFRQWGSLTPGHPEAGHTPGVETTTGPLGQGFAASVGMAIAERHLAARFNKPGFELVDHYTYSIAGDGCLMEGVSSEAASLAGHLGLGKLIVLHDDNKITIEGSTDLAFCEDISKRFEAYGWQVLTVADGNDLGAIEAAINEARAETDKPSLIRVRTEIGYGSPAKQGSAGAHGSPLGAEEVVASKKNLGWPIEPAFYVPDEGKAPFAARGEAGKALHAEWDKKLEEYCAANPELGGEFKRLMAGDLPEGWTDALPSFDADAKGIASRAASGKVINALAPILPELIGGSADLAPSNNTAISGEKDFEAGAYDGRIMRFGVREFGMAAIINGMYNHGMLRPFDATFFAFTDYMRPALRLSALMGLGTIHVMTHDSIYLGEDGPTHQPVEHLPSLRAMPGLSIIRPADANETAVAWRVALEHKNKPTILVLSRQNLPTLDRSVYASAEGVERGGYILKEADGGAPKAIIISSGSEVHLALEAAKSLEAEAIPTRVVNLASWDLFEAQGDDYRASVLPSSVTVRTAVEAAHPLGWDHYVGQRGNVVGMETFGASAPAEVLAKEFGFTVENVVSKVKAQL
ncbi:MAG: transketolase [Deltaproteobacteria bacterium]|nr:MAG: transketolase [Deltaproteobacteria bacterium]